MTDNERPEHGTQFVCYDDEGNELQLVVDEVVDEPEQGLFTVTVQDDEDDQKYDIAFNESGGRWEAE